MLSLSMIVRDEAERLERCLASVKGFVDEMVLVDTGSQDGTVALARRFRPGPQHGDAVAQRRLGAGARWR